MFPLTRNARNSTRSTSSQSLTESATDSPMPLGLATADAAGADATDMAMLLAPDNTDYTKGRCVKTTDDATGDDWHATPFDAKTMFAALQLGHHTKNAACLQSVCILATELSYGASAAAQLKADIERKHTRIPGRLALTRAKVKLDILAMHWMSHVYATHDIAAYDMIDSSPQGGWNFLVMRTDEFLYPRGCTALGRLQTDVHKIHQRRTLPITCLGYGKAGLVQKMQNYVHAGRLESQDLHR
jgi:hypothetical protein